ncbi:hypothetical protein ACEPAF_9701 [Sanghuangporus sanghuang]
MPYPTPDPVPDPGLVGDILDGVGDVVNNAVSGVVGLVTTVLGDVNKLVAPAGTSATTAASGTSAPSASSTPQATTASPNATSTPTSGGSHSGSDGGSSGSNGNSGGSNGSNGNSGGSNGSNSNGNTPSNGNGSTNGSTSNNGSSSNSDSGSSDSDSPSSNPSSSVSNASGISSASGDTNVLESTAIPGPTLSSSASASVSRSDVVNLAQSSASLSGTAATAAPVINAVGSVESEDGFESTLLSGASGTATAGNTLHTSSPTGSSGSGSGSGSNGNNGNSAASSKHGLSPGIIAAIAVISSLAFLVLIIFVTRRWYRKRRERRFENWVSRPGAFAFFEAASVNINDEKSEGAASGSGTRSARSSFGTTIDRGLRPFTPDPFGQSASNFSDSYSATHTSMTFLAPSPVPAPLVTTPPVQRPESAVIRQSLISLASSSSSSYESGGGSGPNNTSTEAVAADRDGSADDHAQYLIVAASQSQNSPNAPQPSPISVRPWSPSERWAFPKPPSSTSTLGNIFYQTPAPPVSQPVESDRMPASNLPPLTPVTPEATNPFADPSQIPDEVTSGPCESTITAKTSLSATDGIVGAIEHIRRPFLPTLADELRVQRGDAIRVLQVFDDGWIQVEKISETSGTETTTSANERGLIPVDCLREADEPLPDFLASRRTKDAGKLTLRSGFELHTDK